ncbi:MAG: SDR family oxidoreductase [Lachnospiraceae bacterium]|nr:SDR family oxidoreductase [Lachnospiraceae bacterium]
MQTLAGRTCCFAGASSGDGVAAVHALCKGGMNVVMISHRGAEAEALAQEINQLGYPGICSVAAEGDEDIMDMYAGLEKKWGSIDVVICNTGADGVLTPIEDVTVEMLMRSIEHLCGGSFEMLQAALPALKKSKAPRVIFMTTVEGVAGGSHESFTNAVAKGAVASLTKNCASRLAPYGITVNAIAKGGVSRPHGKVREDSPKPEDLLPRIPVGRIGTEEDLAQAICYLASEETGYITGQILNVCGGLYMG